MMTQHKEPQTGFKGVLYLLAFMLLTAVAVVLQLRFRGFEGPLSDSLLIIVLINANFLLLAAVIVMIARSLWKLSIERKQRVLGARFRTKLVTAFVSLSFIPPVLLFIIGSGMFTSSIERLFNLRVENSLKASRSVAQAYYDLLDKKALLFGREIVRQMTEEQLLKRFEQPVLKEYLTRKAVEYDLDGVELITVPRERAVTIVTGRFPEKAFTATSFELAARAISGGAASGIIELGKGGQIVRAVVPLHDSEDRKVTALISISYYVPQNLASKAAEINTGYAQYRASQTEKEPIKLAYRLGFLAVTLSLLLAAIWVALRVAAGITVPIQKLAEGTAAVAAGRFDYHIDETSGDEIGVLVDSFNRMTGDLKHSRERLEREIAYKETILSNIDTGVVSLDRAGRITTINRAASDILSVRDQDVLFKRYDEAFTFIELGPVRKLFRRLEEGLGQAEEELSLTVRGRVLTLRMRITTLRDSGGSLVGSVITFDDLTELLRAKKAETWQDVARRIAHEFKNPLTPIKLSAERLRKKHAEGAADFDAVFDECSRTIVQEADGLRKLVDEFANFARMPSSNPVLQPLHLVLNSIIPLYAGAHKDISFVRQFQADMPDVLLDREQIKRVFINLFENAVEAMGGKGTIWVTTSMNASGRAQVEVADSGPGIAPEDVPRVFEPDFSRKKKNGGLGLAIVHKIIADHGGSIRFEQNTPAGARFILDLAVKNG
jgi:two-component system, NtrC family, nitrogen regulation sensor histidine kinase NtrY